MKIALAGALFVVAFAAFSQEPKEAPRKDGSVKSTVSVTGIDLDASAESRGGAPVDDLGADEVTLKIDGKPVSLDYFTRVETGRLAAPARAGAGADAAGLVARHFFLLIDEDHLLPSDRASVFEAARSLLARLEPSDRVAAAVLQAGRLRPLSPFGSTAEEAGRALVAQRKGGLSLGLLFLRNFEGEMARTNERNSFRLIERAVRGFGTYAGRKEMVVISRGLNRYEGTSRALNRELDALVRQANRSRVTIHTIGAAGLESGSVAGSGFC